MGRFVAYSGRTVSSGNPVLTGEARRRAQEGFRAGYEVGEAAALGLEIAAHFEWDGVAICQCFGAALENANFHSLAGEVDGWLRGWGSERGGRGKVGRVSGGSGGGAPGEEAR